MLRDDFPEGPDGVRRGFPVETPVGTMYLNPTGWGVIVDNSSNTMPPRNGCPYLTYRGREFIATIAFTYEGELERCYVSKRGSMSSSSDASKTHKDALVEAAKVAIFQWVDENPGHVARARYEDARIRHEGAIHKLAEARQEYEQAKKDEKEAAKARRSAAASVISG